jgi:hypothetical protein
LADAGALRLRGDGDVFEEERVGCFFEHEDALYHSLVVFVDPHVADRYEIGVVLAHRRRLGANARDVGGVRAVDDSGDVLGVGIGGRSDHSLDFASTDRTSCLWHSQWELNLTPGGAERRVEVAETEAASATLALPALHARSIDSVLLHLKPGARAPRRQFIDIIGGRRRFPLNWKGVTMAGAAEAHVRRRRDAVRILHILHQAGEDVRSRRGDIPATAVKVVRAEKRLQALDFWVRNPDYLAHELLNQYENDHDPESLRLAAEVMQGDEPELRRLGMLRFFFGAFERVHDAVATLKTFQLVDVRPRFRGTPPRLSHRDFYLLEAGAERATELAQDDVLRWYSERAALVARVAGDRSGDALKDAQYSVERYGGARWGEIIAPVRDEVRARLTELQQRNAP